MVTGIDVSHAQGFFDWHRAKASGYEFAFVKATEGMLFKDPQFHNNWSAAQNLGFYVGAYHFFHPKQDAVKQAEHFVQTVGPKVQKQLPFVLDFEVGDGLAAKAIVDSALIFLSTVESLTKSTPIVYCSRGFALPLHLPATFARFPLWEAEYQVSAPKLIPPWTHPMFWQYTDVGGLDKNQFFGSIADLALRVI